MKSGMKTIWYSNVSDLLKNPSSGYEEDNKVRIKDIANVDENYLALSVGFKLRCVDCLVVAWRLAYSNILLYFILKF